MKKWFILIAIACLLFIFNIDFTATNLALASIANELHSNMSSLQWVINGYSLAIACVLLVSGRVSDVIGKYKVYIIGITFFVIGSWLCGASQGVAELIWARLIQGIGGGIASPVMMVLAYQAFPAEQRGLALGFAASAIGFGQALGPSVGGFIIHYFSWHWIFYLNIPVSLVSILIIWLCFHDTQEANQLSIKQIDWGGAFLLAIFLICYCYPLNIATKVGWASLEVWPILTLALIILSALIFYEQKRRHPLVHFELLKNPYIFKYVIMRCFFQWLVFAMPFILALYCQNVLSYSALKTGNLLLVGIIFFAIISPFSGQLFDRLGKEKFCAVGFFFLSLSAIFFALFSYHSSLVVLLIGLPLFGIGYGILQPCMSIGPLKYSTPETSATATGLGLTSSVIGGITGIALAGFAYAALSQYIVMNYLGAAEFSHLVMQYPLLLDLAHGVQQITLVDHLLPSTPQTVILHSYLFNGLVHAMRYVMLAHALMALAFCYYAWKNVLTK